MKKLFTLLTIVLLGVSTWSCSYDDDDLWNEIGNIKTELARINKEIGTLQTLVDALNQQKTSPLSKKRRRGTRLPSTMAKPSKLKTARMPRRSVSTCSKESITGRSAAKATG